MNPSDLEVIKQYINNGQENECVDFKLKTYGNNPSNSEMAKDVAAFANGDVKADKFIIMGVDDTTKKIIGILDAEKFNPSAIENSIAEKIEPRMSVVCGVIELDSKKIAYIKIPKKNDNSPYIIKKDCGKNVNVREGDIFVRVGTCNRKANREDLDRMYRENSKISIDMYSNLFSIGTMQIGKAKKDVVSVGSFEIELNNPTANSIVLCDGKIIISNKYDKIERRIFGFQAEQRFDERPYTLMQHSREVKKIYFDFLSEDCLRLRFEDDGKLQHYPTVKVELFDTDDNVYVIEKNQAIFLARGSVLHKIKRFYKEFRQSLSYNHLQLVKSIEKKDNDSLLKILDTFHLDFTFMQPGYVLCNSFYPEYDVLYSMVREAIEGGNNEALNILSRYGLSEEFVKLVKDKIGRINV